MHMEKYNIIHMRMPYIIHIQIERIICIYSNNTYMYSSMASVGAQLQLHSWVENWLLAISNTGTVGASNKVSCHNFSGSDKREKTATYVWIACASNSNRQCLCVDVLQRDTKRLECKSVNMLVAVHQQLQQSITHNHFNVHLRSSPSLYIIASTLLISSYHMQSSYAIICMPLLLLMMAMSTFASPEK